MIENYIKINRQAWDLRTGSHVNSVFYDVDGFLNGKSTLNKTELELLPNLDGADLLHLQCHFGLDTLSLARKGAIVTGVDFVSEALQNARLIAKKANLAASFYNLDVQSIGDRFKSSFDIVYTSYGVLCWLSDLDRWANGIKESLRKGGKFVLVEYHPMLDVVFKGYISGRERYFPSSKLVVERSFGTYTDKKANISYKECRWPHSLSEIIMALCNAGLIIKSFKEYPYSPYKLFPTLDVKKDGVWYNSDDYYRIPYLFSIVAEL